jgi:hypothetical protein
VATDPLVLAAADPVAVAVAWLRTHPLIFTEFGEATHISGTNRAPYPHIRITPTPAGDERGMVWASDHELSLEVYGDPDGTPGQAALRRLYYLAAGALAELPDRTDITPLDVVVARVRPTSAGRFVTDPVTEQQRWSGTFMLTVRPPDVVI